MSAELPVATFDLTGVPEVVRSELFAPISLRCTTKEGDAYGSVGFAGASGWGFEEQDPAKLDAASKSTVVVDANTPPGIRISSQYQAHPGNPRLRSTGGMGFSGGWGSASMSKLPVPLTDINSVNARLELVSPLD